MKIGIFSQWYTPEAGSAAHPAAIAASLRDQGHTVSVLTGFPNYPNGKVFDGYSLRMHQKEEIQGVVVRRVPYFPSHSANALVRAISMLSFAVSASAQSFWFRRQDVCLVYLTPATVGLAGYVLKKIWNVPYVVYVQDLWPDTVGASQLISSPRINKALEFLLHHPLRKLYEAASQIAAISPTMADALRDRGRDLEPIIVPNWIDETTFRPGPKTNPIELTEDRRWIMYAGGMGEVQGLEHAVDAMSAIDPKLKVGLAFVGDGICAPQLRKQVDVLGLADRVVFLGSRPIEEMSGLISTSAAQLVSLRDEDLFRGTIPSKLQASMACGAPVICAVAGDASELVARAGNGLIVPPESTQDLAWAFDRVGRMSDEELSNMAHNSLRYYLENLSASVGGLKLEQLLLEAFRGRI